MELRMLSGLHRGAVLELDDDELVLGASDQADVIIADPGVAQLHLRILKKPEGHFLAPDEGQVESESGHILEQSVLLTNGMRFRVGDIWIGFFEADAAWGFLPPEIVSDLSPDLQPAQGQGLQPVRSKGPADKSAPPGSADGAASASASGTPGKRVTRRSAIWGSAALLLVPMLAWLITTAHASFISEEAIGAAAPTRMTALQIAKAAAAVTSAPISAGDRLLDDFKKTLAERELLERVDLHVQAGQGWEVRGALDAEEAARLERIASGFAETRKLSFPIHVRVVPLKDMLPFEIVEVATGAGGHIVTGDGQRLFVGDALEGYRLVSVTASKIAFTGKRRLELTW